MRFSKKISSVLTLSLATGLLGLTGSPAQAVAPVGANFVVTADDLRFIMTQIKISEAHATQLTTAPTKYTANGQPIVTPWTTPLVDGSTVATNIPNPDLPWGLRQVDGRNNNLTNTAGVPTRGDWGASDTPFPRLTAAHWRAVKKWSYGGGTGATTTYEDRVGSLTDADPRLISNLIVDQSECNPAALAAANNLNAYVPCGVAASISTATADGTNITFETNSPHALTTGDKVSISGVSPSAYNVEGQVVVLSPTSFSVVNALSSGTAAGAGGKVTAVTTSTKTKFKTDQAIVNQSPNGKSAPASGIFTIFGQFFDHGLDLVGKSSTDIVFIPLKSDDPLYVAGGRTNFMAMSRTILGNGRADSTGMAPAGDNSTTPYVDQNQTYTSISSHQVFLREYVASATGPKTTGNFADGVDGGLATWKDIKTQSKNLLGIELVDTNISDVPNLLTNEFGKFLPGPSGLPMLAIKSEADVPGVSPGSIGFVEGNVASPILTDGTLAFNVWGRDAITGAEVVVVPAGTRYNAIRTGHAFLNDINHCAAPGSDAQSTSDCTQTDFNVAPSIPGLHYSQAALESHFITGDGRGNENIGLTSIHTVFHSEHNRLINDPNIGYKNVIATEAVTLATAARRTYVADWVNEAIPGNATPAFDALTFQPFYTVGGVRTNLTWNGEHLFQAARFANEMEYQHLVFAEFLRMVEPAIAPFAGYDINVRGDIYAEFAHAVYRYGHSQLTHMIDRTAVDGTPYSDTLFNSFLSPEKFNTGPNGSHITAQEAVGGLARGMSGQTANEIDEFVSSDLRNSLLGIPLDLATLNIARGRDSGMGSLNEVRSDLLLKPYANWFDFGNSLRHPESLANFIAAYATADTALGATVVAETSINGKRGAAQAILNSFTAGDADAAAFILGTAVDGSGNRVPTGIDSVDLWVGGLAESTGVCVAAACPLLGETMATVFRRQMEDLQAGDRLYYLSRLGGLNLGLQVESNTLSEIIQRNSDAQNLPALIMTTADYTVESTANGANCPTVQVRNLRDNSVLPSINTIASMFNVLGCRLQALTGANGKNIVYGGSNDANKGDNIHAGNGDDTLRGNDGNDLVNAGDGNNQIYGGNGNDVLVDEGNSSSIGVLNGGDGNDVLLPGNGLKGNNPGRGDDIVIAGVAPAVGLMGLGNDKFLGNDTGDDVATGDDGSDWLEGHGGLDALTGDAAAVFGIDTVKFGSDYLWGGSANDVLDGGGASDILGEGDGGAGSDTMTGGFGWDWVTAQGATTGAYYDGLCGNAVALTPVGGVGVVQCPAGFVDAFIDPIEGMVGGAHDDYMRGDDSLTYAATPGIANSSNDLIGSDFYKLSETGIRISNGLNTVLGIALPADNATAVVRTGNIMLGGDGSDRFMGGGGNDTIFGDATQTVQLRVPNAIGGYVTNTVPGGYTYVTSMNDLVSGKTVRSLLETQTVSPSDLIPVIDYSRGTHGLELDTAIFSLGSADYTYVTNADGSLTVTQVTAPPAGGFKSDDSDRLYGIEQIQFLNLGTTAVASAPIDVTHGLVASAPNAVNAVPASSTSSFVSWTAPTYPNNTFVGPITNYSVFVTNSTPLSGLTVTGTAAGNGTRIRYNVVNAGATIINVGDVVTISGFTNGELNQTNAVVLARTGTTVDIASASVAAETLPLASGARIVKATVTTTANATTLGINIPGLVAGTNYAVAVRANSGANAGAISSPPATVVPAIVAPSVVQNVSAINTGLTSINVTWTAPAIAGDASTLSYQVDLIDTSNGNSLASNVCSSSILTSCAVTGLITDHQYSVIVYAKNTSLLSAGSNPVTVSPSEFPYPSAVRNLVLQTAGTGRLALDWTAPLTFGKNAITGNASYTATATAAGRPTRTCTVANGAPLSCYITGLVDNVAYTVSIVATNSNAISSIVPATGTITTSANTAPGAPTALAIGSVNATSLTLTWAAPIVSGSDRITSYTARAYTAATGGAAVSSCISNGSTPITASCVIPGLSSGTQYWVSVVATNAAGQSSVEPVTRTVTGFSGSGNVTTSVLTTSAATVIADGTTTATLSLQMKGSTGVNLTTNGGTTPTFTNTGGGVISNIAYTSNGVWTATYRAPIEAGAADVVTARINGVAVVSTVSIASSAQVVDGPTSTVQVTDSIVDVQVSNTTTVSVTLKTASGQTIAGAGTAPSISTDLGTITGITSRGAGVWTATYTAPASNIGTAATISVTVGSTTKTVPLTISYQLFSGANSVIYAGTPPTVNTSIELNGVNTAQVTVQLKDSIGGNLVPNGTQPVFTLTPNVGSITAAVSQGAGKWTATYTPPLTDPGVPVVVSAVSGSTALAGTAAITMVPQTVSYANSTISSAVSTLEANGVKSTTVYVQYKDAANVNISGNGPTPVLNVTLGEVGAMTSLTNGRWSGTFTTPLSATATTSTIGASSDANGIGTAIEIALVPQVASAARSTVQVTNSALEANGVNSTTATVTLKDSDGIKLAWAGNQPGITANRGSISGIQNPSAGVWTATYTTPTTSGTPATISGSIGGTSITSTASVALNAQTVSLANSTIPGAPISLEANGSSTATISVQLKDLTGVNLYTSGTQPTLTLTPNVGSIGVASYTGNGIWSATYTAPTTNAGSSVTIGATTGSGTIAGTRTVNLVAQTASTATSTVTASASQLQANGVNRVTISVQLKDSSGTNLFVNGPTPVLSALAGSFAGSIASQGNGLWTQDFIAPTSISGSPVLVRADFDNAGLQRISSSASIQLVAPTVSVATSVVDSSVTTEEANGVNTIAITVDLRDAANVRIPTAGSTPSFSATINGSPAGAGAWPVAANWANGVWNGTYRVPAEAMAGNNVVISAIYGGNPITDKATIALTLPVADATKSTMTVSNLALATPITGTATGDGTRITYLVDTATQNGIAIGDFVSIQGFANPSLNVQYGQVDTQDATSISILSSVVGSEVAPAGATVLKETTASAIEADGFAQGIVRVQLKDKSGVNISSNRGTVTLNVGAGTLTSPTYVVGSKGLWESTYTAPLPDGISMGVQTITVNLDGSQLFMKDVLSLVQSQVNVLTTLLSTNAPLVQNIPTLDIPVAGALPQSIVSLTLKNAWGTELGYVGGQTVTFSTKSGTLSPMVGSGSGSTVTATFNNATGKYEAKYSPSTRITGTTKVYAYVNGQKVKSNAGIRVRTEVADQHISIDRSAVWVPQSTLLANGSSVADLRFTMKNEDGALITDPSGYEVMFASTIGASADPMPATYMGDAVWGASMVLPKNASSGTAVIQAMVTDTANREVQNQEVSSTATIQVVSASANINKSAVSVANSSLAANGASQTAVILELRDSDGVKLGRGTDFVSFRTTIGRVSNATYDSRTDQWIATFTSPSGITGLAIVNAFVNGSEIASVASVQVTVPVVATPSTQVSGATAEIAMAGSATGTRNKFYAASVTFPSKFKSAKTTIVVKSASGKKVASSTSTQKGKSKANVKVKIPKKLAPGTYTVSVSVKVGSKVYSSSTQTITVN